MSLQQNPRPWYAPDGLVDDYVNSLTTGGDLKMLKTLKILRAIIVNLGVIGITGYALFLGADPTIVGGFALAVFGGYNGLEIGDYAALLQAYAEVSGKVDSDDGDSGN